MNDHIPPFGSVKLALQLGLSEEEWHRIVALIDRVPNVLELAIFSALWNEHCSYKSSRIYLKQFASTSKKIVQGPGENAGAIDLGGGLACVFKIESHNHPSYIEPVQGAATGVGGILRDIFTMGARPIALLNSLRFGSPTHPKTPFLLSGVVKGIGSYANAVGVPTVGGDTYFDACYNDNILVNAFALGVCTHLQLTRAVATGVSNLIVYLGAQTGRDGIHGASMASQNFDDTSKDKRPTVQVGDPFVEKKLIEACLFLVDEQLIVGMQDMGAAGLSSSSVEMAVRGGFGVRLDLARVPVREPGMSPAEMMLSESQERMLLCVTPACLDKVKDIARHFELPCEVIGEVIQSPELVLSVGHTTVAILPLSSLSRDVPMYEHNYVITQPREYLDDSSIPDLADCDLKPTLLRLISSPNLSSRRFIYEQYDQEVLASSVRMRANADAAVVALRGIDKTRQDALAMTVDVNGQWLLASAYDGAQMCMMEAYRNLCATGAMPIGVSDCLNFASPKDPVVMGQFVQTCKALASAANVLDVPIVSGNVSFYNQTQSRPIAPTPTIAMVGHIEDLAKTGTIAAHKTGLDVWLYGVADVYLDVSEFLHVIHGQRIGGVRPVDLLQEKAICDHVKTLWTQSLLHAAHDLSEGGLLVALAECVLESSVGICMKSDYFNHSVRLDKACFGEGGSRFILFVEPQNRSDVQQRLSKVGTLTLLGETTAKTELDIQSLARWTKEELKMAHESFFERQLFA